MGQTLPVTAAKGVGMVPNQSGARMGWRQSPWRQVAWQIGREVEGSRSHTVTHSHKSRRDQSHVFKEFNENQVHIVWKLCKLHIGNHNCDSQNRRNERKTAVCHADFSTRRSGGWTANVFVSWVRHPCGHKCDGNGDNVLELIAPSLALKDRWSTLFCFTCGNLEIS